jgi:hypothetical protein
MMPLAAAVLGLVGSGFMSKGQIDENDRILETAGPQILQLRQCYKNNNTRFLSNTCAHVMRDPIESVFEACSFEENKLAMILQDASPSIGKQSVARILLELRSHARVGMERQILQNQERAQVCLLDAR